MKGSRIADEIIADMKREEIFKELARRNKLNKEKQSEQRKVMCEEKEGE